jgi:hypothetical protein
LYGVLIPDAQDVVDALLSSDTAIEGGASLPQAHASFLKAVLRAVTRLMSNNQGADALRNLIDTSLPTTVHRILLNRNRFGPQIYALGALFPCPLARSHASSSAQHHHYVHPQRADVAFDLAGKGIPYCCLRQH